MQKDIELVIFDLGDVLVGIDEDRGFFRLSNLIYDEQGLLVADKEISAFLFSPDDRNRNPWHNLQHGIDKTPLIPELVRDRAGPHVPPELLHDALCDIFDPLPERQRVFHALIAENYPAVALLSDTVPAHIQKIERDFPALLSPLPSARRFYSYDIGAMKKHGAAPYDHVVRKMGADPMRTLMIDDRLPNKPGADAAGIRFAHVTKEQDLATILQSEWGINIPPVTRNASNKPKIG